MRGRRLLGAAAALLAVTGAGLAVYSYVQVRAEQSDQQRLVQQWRASLPSPQASVAADPLPTPSPSAAPLPPVPSGRWFLMRVPGTGYAEVVREGVDEASLNAGPGHYPDTAWPGWPGNVGIGVHNTYWLGVGRLDPGRTVVLETEYGVFTYRIGATEIVPPDRLGLFTQAGPARLTLTTCWPLWAGAAATERLVMTGNLVTAEWRIPWPPR